MSCVEAMKFAARRLHGISEEGKYSSVKAESARDTDANCGLRFTTIQKQGNSLVTLTTRTEAEGLAAASVMTASAT